MYLYVIAWEERNGQRGIFDSYHDGGGIVAIAEDYPQLLGMMYTHNEMSWTERFFPGYKINVDNVTLDKVVYSLPLADDIHPELWPFPDAGCC